MDLGGAARWVGRAGAAPDTLCPHRLRLMQPAPDEARRDAAEDAQWSRWGLAVGVEGGLGAGRRSGEGAGVLGRDGSLLPRTFALPGGPYTSTPPAFHPGPVPPATHPEPPALSPGCPGPGGGASSVLSWGACPAGRGGSQAWPPHPPGLHLLTGPSPNL